MYNKANTFRLHSLGDYKDFRDICHKVKDGLNSKEYIESLTYTMYKRIKDLGYTCLIPIPSSKSDIMTKVCENVAKQLHISVSYCLEKTSDKTVYEMKKEGKHITYKDVPISIWNHPHKGTYLLVDNVVATGSTITKCQRLLNSYCDVFVIAVDWKEFNNINNKQYGLH